MEARLDRVEDKLDQVLLIQADIRADLQDHMRRTIINENNVDKIVAALAPVQEHVAFVRGLGKLLTILGTLLGGLFAAWQALFHK